MRRLLVAALVAAPLAFSVGGVAVSGRADSAQSQSSNSQCEAPIRNNGSRVTAPPVSVDDGDTIVLNTRGYNYADPGMVQMDPLNHPAPAPAKPAPASPAKP